jgi:hypothetical protein
MRFAVRVPSAVVKLPAYRFMTVHELSFYHSYLQTSETKSTNFTAMVHSTTKRFGQGQLIATIVFAVIAVHGNFRNL